MTETYTTKEIVEAIATMVLLKIYAEKISDEFDYEIYDGSKLPKASGYSLTNAMTTYISHGGDKSVAIDKFIQQHLSKSEDLEKFLSNLHIN